MNEPFLLPTASVFLFAFFAIACAIVGGVFLAFSDFIMRSLAKSAATAGIEAMQIINREVYHSLFMVLLLGMSGLSVLILGGALVFLNGPTQGAAIVGALIYIVGVLGVTLTFNVPMNKRLDVLNFASDHAATYWKDVFLPNWTFWNWVRGVAAMAVAPCFLVVSFWLT
jgi:uncharacterized membrane protein